MKTTKKEREYIDVEDGELVELPAPVEVVLVDRLGSVTAEVNQETGVLKLRKQPGTRIAKLVDVPMTDVELARERVKEAEAVLKEAEAEAEALRKAEYDERIAKEFEELMATPDEDFYAKEPGFDERPYILPFGRDFAKFNPLDDADRVDHEFGSTWTAHSTAIICKKDERTRPTRLIWTSGWTLRHESDKIGQRFKARHDQTGGSLGIYEIVGLAFYGPDGSLARYVGDVPSIKFAQSTYK